MIRWLKLPDVFIVFISVRVFYSIIFLHQFLSFPEEPINSNWFWIQITQKPRCWISGTGDGHREKLILYFYKEKAKNSCTCNKVLPGAQMMMMHSMIYGGGLLQFSYLNGSKYNNYSHKPHNYLQGRYQEPLISFQNKLAR